MSEESGTELLHWLARAVRAGLRRGAMVFLWLIVFGAAATASTPVGVVLLLTGLAAFVLMHVVRRLPPGWDHGRLGPPPPSVFTAGLLIALVFLLGDVLWIVYRDALDSEGEPETFIFRAAIVLAFPLVEEFGFRLWLQSPLERHLGRAGAVVAVALLFASSHGTELPLGQFLGACLYGATLIATGSIWAPVAMHAFQNATLVALDQVPAVGEWAIATAEASPGWLLPGALTAWAVAAGAAFLWLRGVRRSS